jgi:CheY-like chemotaxis protein
VHVTADAGSVELSLKRSVLLRDRLETEFEAILEKVPGVQTFRVSTPSKDANMSQIIPFSDTHQRIMLVDDEREFVQTLSERLMTRHIPTTVEYSGEAALETIKERAPEVMILDLKMPGINGIEVLRRVKSEHPEVEVIILTGHGSDADREACMAMGAYAYLEKPVDIDALSDAIRQVYRKGKRIPDLGGSE